MGEHFDEALQDLIAKIAEKVRGCPELMAIMDQAKAGTLSQTQALNQMNEYLLAHPEIAIGWAQAAETELVPHQSSIEDVLPPDGPLALFTPSSEGLPRLNPLIEGALIERAQFDGDIPELRTGPLPQGAPPAVPVKTKVRDPAALGKMLTNASERVGKQIQEHEAGRAEALAASPEVLAAVAGHAELVKKSDVDTAVALYGSSETDHPSYRRGGLPEPVQTRRPSGSALATMTPQEKREKAFKFFSTTQGRRSATPIIRELVAVALRSEGLEVEERDFNPRAPREDPLAAHEWSVTLAGAGSTQAAFSVIDVSARVLTKALLKGLEGREAKRVLLEVAPINQVDIRTVGWAARLLPSDPVPVG